MEAKLPSTLVEVRPPFIPLEIDPPLPSSGGGRVKQEILSPGDSETPSSTSWGDQVEKAEASGQLASDAASAPGRAKPNLFFESCRHGDVPALVVWYRASPRCRHAATD